MNTPGANNEVFQPLHVPGYSVLLAQLSKKGRLKGFISVGITGWWVDAQGRVTGAQTAAGVMRGLPILGPDGEVTLDGGVFPGLSAYADWLKAHLQ